jgi:hypothetical protein
VHVRRDVVTHVPEGARLDDLKPPAAKAVGGGAFLLLVVHGDGVGEGLEEEMARALAGMCGVGARGGVYMVARGRWQALTPPLKTSMR